MARLLKMRRLAGLLELAADDLQMEFECRQKAARAGAGGGTAVPFAALEAFRSVAQSRVRKAAEAANGASRIESSLQPDGYLKVSIDGRTARLAPRLASLFSSLISDNGSSDDLFVPWKSKKEIKQALAKDSGKPLTDAALTNLIYRLRDKLVADADLHPDFIQRHHQFGMRFALRRETSP